MKTRGLVSLVTLSIHESNQWVDSFGFQMTHSHSLICPKLWLFVHHLNCSVIIFLLSFFILTFQVIFMIIFFFLSTFPPTPKLFFTDPAYLVHLSYVWRFGIMWKIFLFFLWTLWSSHKVRQRPSCSADVFIQWLDLTHSCSLCVDLFFLSHSTCKTLHVTQGRKKQFPWELWAMLEKNSYQSCDVLIGWEQKGWY